MSDANHSTAPDPPEPIQGQGNQPPQPANDAATIVAAAGDGAELSPDAENELWQGRTDWKHYILRVSVVGLLLVGLGFGLYKGASSWNWLSRSAAIIVWGVAALIVAAIVLTKPIMAIIGQRYRVTTQRLFIERGIFSQTIDQTELIRVDDVRIYKTFSDRIFGLGTIAILSTDASDREVRIEGIANSESVAEAIRGRMRNMRRKSLFVENL